VIVNVDADTFQDVAERIFCQKSPPIVPDPGMRHPIKV